jgi:hypothetical protein
MAKTRRKNGERRAAYKLLIRSSETKSSQWENNVKINRNTKKRIGLNYARFEILKASIMKVTSCYKCTNQEGVTSQKTAIFMYAAESGYDEVADYCNQN